MTDSNIETEPAHKNDWDTSMIHYCADTVLRAPSPTQSANAVRAAPSTQQINTDHLFDVVSQSVSHPSFTV